MITKAQLVEWANKFDLSVEEDEFEDEYNMTWELTNYLSAALEDHCVDLGYESEGEIKSTFRAVLKEALSVVADCKVKISKVKQKQKWSSAEVEFIVDGEEKVYEFTKLSDEDYYNTSFASELEQFSKETLPGEFVVIVGECVSILYCSKAAASEFRELISSLD